MRAPRKDRRAARRLAASTVALRGWSLAHADGLERALVGLQVLVDDVEELLRDRPDAERAVLAARRAERVVANAGKAVRSLAVELERTLPPEPARRWRRGRADADTADVREGPDPVSVPVVGDTVAVVDAVGDTVTVGAHRKGRRRG